jgi:hypothetical protein
LCASQTSIRPLEFLAKSYARETAFEFKQGEKYPVVHVDDEGYYVHVVDGHDCVLRLVNLDELPARLVEDQLSFWESYTFETERAYLVFLPDVWLRVLDETEAGYRIEYVFGQTKMHFTVDKSEFITAKHVVDSEGRLVDRLVAKPQDAICVLEFSSGVSGSGFLLYVDDQLYCYTNQHVAMNIGKLTVSLIDGSQLQLGEIEIAEDVDLARIKILDDLPGFEVQATPRMQEQVRVLGNSLGAGRITVLPGKVSGLNSKEIETTAKFVSGNSGSPILNARKEVVGVATLIEYFPDHQAIIAGSDFEDGRRVGVRLDRSIKWIPVDMGQYISRNRHILQTLTFIDELPYAMVASIQNRGTTESEIQLFTDSGLKQWLRYMGTGMRTIRQKYQKLISAGMARQGNRYMYTSSYTALQKAYMLEALEASGNYWNSLQQKVIVKKRSIERATPSPDIPYMRDKIAYAVEMLDAALLGIASIQETHKAYAEEL